MIMNLNDYLERLEKIQVELDELPDLDERSLEFYEEIYDRVDEEYDRVQEIAKHIPRID